ncbi:uncharacterized protein [Montipora foliosa]|uniref:uncharacterized protein isoform X2 n=1 Tax=Montipora foliosa TaxID=591990 RepID=UPI0035F1A5F4
MSVDRSRSWSRGSDASQVSFSSQTERNGISKLDSLLEHDGLPQKVKDYSWELQHEFSKSLNPHKESGNDWRVVASRLQFSRIIPQLEKKENPTVELLRECTETTTRDLLKILVDVNRTDVLDDILKFVNVEHVKLLAKSPTQESITGDSCANSLSWPLQDSGNASDVPKGNFDPRESLEEADEDFLSDESKRFWLNIPGDYERKNWTNFIQAAKNLCPKEIQQGNVEKFLCKVLRIEYGQAKDNYVRLDSFLTLVALFGPFKQGPEGCLQKMYDLMQQSISKREGTKESWFAGHLDETEAENLLGNQSPGHFLIRISSSRAHEGVFVLAVKTSNSGVVQIQIERKLQDSTLVLADQQFSDLMSLVNALRRDVLLENCRQLLINPCPNLPLNAIFSGYMEATARRGGRGRGRPRR